MPDSELMHATVAFEIQQFLGELFHELDNDGLNVTEFYFEDGIFEVAGREFKGHAGVRQFYADRLEQVRAKQGGIRTSRHTYVNLRFTIEDRNHAQLDFINLTYAGVGPPPVMNLIGPAVVSDVHMICQRAGDGRWRLKRFVGGAVFIGSDPLMNKMAVKN